LNGLPSVETSSPAGKRCQKVDGLGFKVAVSVASGDVLGIDRASSGASCWRQICSRFITMVSGIGALSNIFIHQIEACCASVVSVETAIELPSHGTS
jgi:hypothetical protein